MKILVTGGAGFIGSAVVRLAIDRGHEIINLDAITYAASLESVASVENHHNYKFVQSDIRDNKKLDSVQKKQDEVNELRSILSNKIDKLNDNIQKQNEYISKFYNKIKDKY